LQRSLLALATALALGCATTRHSAETEHSGEAAAVPAESVTQEGAAVEPGSEAAAEDEYRTFRLGFWELDLLALDFEPRGTTFRLLDFRILRLLEIGGGPEYHAFSLVEMPVLFNVFTSRRDGITRELRIADVQAVATAVVRHTRESESEYQTHLLKLPVIGSFFSRQRDDGTEHQTFLFLFRREVER
jgi:hypothetical protein